ncbi:MAG TPA: GNAT family N-acetyltransferase [Alphaproteobacteria bacterium]|nr:GNAT family N-acetyltransferase [Alphaproteobacteria bacterium]
MPDMLVKLYGLPDLGDALAKAARARVEVRRPNPWEKAPLLAWIGEIFNAAWAAECEAAFATNPPSCFIAKSDDGIVGFACHDCTRRNFFGPTGVAEPSRGKGIGRALLLSCLHAMHANGYAYAIIGGVGPADYYAKAVGAISIEGSSPGIYDHGRAIQRN